MPAYYLAKVPVFVAADPVAIVGQLHAQYALDGYAKQYTAQTQAWATTVPLLQQQMQSLIVTLPKGASWSILLEFPLYRLRKRIDVVVLTDSAIVVVEAKCGETEFHAADERQVEEYGLDLRDFHAESRARLIIPVLWATAAPVQTDYFCPGESTVSPVVRVGSDGFAALLVPWKRIVLQMESWRDLMSHGHYRTS